MEPEILDIKLIPDLLNLVNDYTLTPYQYHKLIDNKKYTEQEYQKFRDEYEIAISKTIVDAHASEYNTILETIKNIDFQFSSTPRILTTFEKEQIKSEIIHKHKKIISDFFIKYIHMLVLELKNSRIFEVTDFRENIYAYDPDITLGYSLYGTHYSEYIFEPDEKWEIVSGDTQGSRSFLIISVWNGEKYQSTSHSVESALFDVYIHILDTYIVLKEIKKVNLN